jgi:general secretion pathway protein D
MKPASGWFWVLLLAACLSWAGGAEAAKDPPSGKVTLNFVNADISAVIKAMSEMTGRTFVVDPRVKGTLNITSPKPLPTSVAYDIMLATLRMQGYAAVQSDGVVRVVPEADAKFYAQPVSKRSRRSRVGGEMVTRVFTMHHVPALQLLAALRPLVGPNSTMNADSATNTLVVTDYADNINRLAQVIDNLDVADIEEPVLIPLKYVSADQVAALVSRVFSPTRGPGVGGTAFDQPQVEVDDRSNSLIVRSRDPSMVSRVQSLVASLDQPTPVAGNVHVIYLKNANATDVAKTLRDIMSGDTSPLSPSQGTSTATTTTAGAQAHTPMAASSSKGQVSGPGMIQADGATNALIITAPEAIYENLKKVVDKLDVRRAQVLVEAIIAEVSEDKAAQFGIQWMHVGSNGIVGFGNSGTNNIGVLSSNPANALTGATQGLNIGLGGGLKTLVDQTTGTTVANGVTTTTVLTPAVQVYSLGVLATALQNKAGANILSTPTLLTLDNEEAKISVGSNVPFATGSYTNTGASSTSVSPFTTYQRTDVGLTLKVKPQISQGGTVMLKISEEVSKLQPSTNPTLAATDKRSLDTSVLVNDGQIIVLGGLIEDEVDNTEDRVPLLGDIPLLGRLFRYNTREHKKTNLMIFLRPVIIRNAADAAAVTNPRYDYILGKQKGSGPGHDVILPDMPPPTLDELPKSGQAAPAVQDKADTSPRQETTPVKP